MSAETRYLVTYDICDPKRLRNVYDIMRGAGVHLQYSVFLCDLSDLEKERLMTSLLDVVQAFEDQVLFVDLGPANGRASDCFTAVGRPMSKISKAAIIV